MLCLSCQVEPLQDVSGPAHGPCQAEEGSLPQEACRCRVNYMYHTVQGANQAIQDTHKDSDNIVQNIGSGKKNGKENLQ